MNDNFEPVEIPPFEDEAEETPYWTAWRVIYLVVALIVIVALLAAMLWPLLVQITQPTYYPPTPTFPVQRA
jgi:hypothetical protein